MCHTVKGNLVNIPDRGACVVGVVTRMHYSRPWQMSWKEFSFLFDTSGTMESDDPAKWCHEWQSRPDLGLSGAHLTSLENRVMYLA